MAPSAPNRTIVRARSWLERVVHPLAVRSAAQAWFTTPPPIPRESLPPLAPGEPARVVFDGRALHAMAWGAGPPVYLVHGWGGRSEQLGGFVAPLVTTGHRVVAYDAPSHGASGPGAFGPRSSTIPEFADALRAAVAAHGAPHAVIAHSMGAAAVAHAMRAGLRPEALVLLAPTAYARWVLDTFVERARIGPWVRRGLERAVVRRVGLPWEAFDVPALAGSLDVPPALVVHDRGDREIGFAHGRAIADAWPGARLLATDGLGHRRLLRDETVIAEVVRFVSEARDGAKVGRSA
jgi:pimeloyl-ACP methyl ester carboxylesterase